MTVKSFRNRQLRTTLRPLGTKLQNKRDKKQPFAENWTSLFDLAFLRENELDVLSTKNT